MVREQNSITGQSRPVTTWTSVRSTRAGLAEMRCRWDCAGTAAAATSEAARTAAEGGSGTHAAIVPR